MVTQKAERSEPKAARPRVNPNDLLEEDFSLTSRERPPSTGSGGGKKKLQYQISLKYKP
jgi:hypothetical protein